MNKYLSALFFSAALLSMSSAQAQYTGPKVSLNGIHPSAKTTETKRRVIAEANFEYTPAFGFKKTDSTKLEWYGSMGHDRYPTISPVFTYGKAKSEELHKKNFSDTAQAYSKMQRIYDAGNNVTYSVLYFWNTTTTSWDSSTRTSYVYIGGKLLQDETQQKVGGRGWLNRTRNEYTYKAGQLDEKISYTFKTPFLNDLKYYSKTNYTYTSGSVNSITTALWDSSASVSPGFYNANRLYLGFSGKDTILKTTQVWDKAFSDWRNVERKSYNFSKGPYSEDLTERWDSKTSVWQNYAKDSLIYTGGLLVTHVLFSWISSSKTWGVTQLYAFEYTGANLTTSRQLQWDGTKWIDDYATRYEYDTHNDVFSVSNLRWDGTKFNPNEYKALTLYYYEEYTPTTIGNVSGSIAQIKLYPNPAVHHHAYLDFFTDKNTTCDIQVVDMLGKEVLRISEQGFRGDHSVLLQLDHAPNGVYLVNLFSEGKVQSQLKLVK
jgi:hypothetical protein